MFLDKKIMRRKKSYSALFLQIHAPSLYLPSIVKPVGRFSPKRIAATSLDLGIDSAKGCMFKTAVRLGWLNVLFWPIKSPIGWPKYKIVIFLWTIEFVRNHPMEPLMTSRLFIIKDNVIAPSVFKEGSTPARSTILLVVDPLIPCSKISNVLCNFSGIWRFSSINKGA